MRRALKLFFGALVIVVVGGRLRRVVRVRRPRARPTRAERVARRPSPAGPATPNGAWHVRAGTRSVYVGYRIKELFGDAVLKHDVVGRTRAVTGTLTIAHDHVDDGGRERRRDQARQRAREARDTYILDNGLESYEVPDRTLHAHRADRAAAATSPRAGGARAARRDACCCTA